MLLFMDAVNAMGPTKYVLLAVIILAIICLPLSISYQKKMKKKQSDFIEQHPDYAKVYVDYSAFGIKTESMSIQTVDGSVPDTYTYHGKPLLVLPAGEHVLEASYSNTRPGVMYKSVTKSFGPMKVQVNLETGKSYAFSFHPKEKEFHIEERTV